MDLTIWVSLYTFSCGKILMRVHLFNRSIMDKKTVEWKWDRESSQFLLNGLHDTVKKAVDISGASNVLDLGGQSGSLSYRTGIDRPICIDLEPKKRFENVMYIKGDIRELPFEDGVFELVLAKAVLHHVPDELDDTLREIHRITKKNGYLVIEEPLSNNPFSSIAGKFFTTTIHDKDERPLDPRHLISKVDKYFCSLEIRPFFLTTYLMPHIISRIPNTLKPSLRNTTKLMHRFDESILSKFPCLRTKSSYLAITAKR